MLQGKVEERLSEERRKEIFQALVDTQDTGKWSVPQSRKVVAERFGVSENEIRRIELEGLDHQWPPL